MTMNFSDFQAQMQTILTAELPTAEAIISQGHVMAKDLRIGRTAFFDKMEVASEAEYKQRCIRAKQIMYHAHIGMSSWQATAEALQHLYQTAEEHHFVIDRAGICLDRRMGLPQKYRKQAPAETGPLLESLEDWWQIGQVVPIQAHTGDFMIGFPSATENTINALKAGVTTIGNLSQFFAHEVPMWRDPVTTTAETVRAIAIMAALREQGTLVHSYLEDGFAALFHDCTTVAGWAYLERYIVEQLLDAKLAHCIGGLTSSPVKRAGWVFALDSIHNHDCIGSMFYGDTISFSRNFAINRGLVAEYLLWDMLAQLECPTGHAVHPLPVTEAVRVPSAEEIAEMQIFGHRLEEAARRLWPYIDFSASHAFAENIVSAGKEVFTSALDGLQEAGVDTQNPVQLLYVLKRLGPAVFEEMFGSGREPLVPTDVFEMSLTCMKQYRPLFKQLQVKQRLYGRRMLIASTDVHEHAILVIHQLLSEAGVEMINFGPEKNPDEVADEACARKVEAILISTHNGVALDYARRLKAELRKHQAEIPVLMGGVLNQKFEDQALPVDVTQSLKELGMYPCVALEGGIRRMLAANEKQQQK
ncbi:MAG: cobalamin-dependent protein [Candidatus Vecturithrix sp.]|jgi:methylmalonyl-CoA mutase cobalamin-binding subunit|nr:cobalamin-dependent protein [Candidatus Vecturithrix sp.]